MKKTSKPETSFVLSLKPENLKRKIERTDLTREKTSRTVCPGQAVHLATVH